ncbi:glutamine--fructose-6-phosphate transaminase (isomerizing) [Parvibaculum sp.]|jgi:glucosamine--fructose-6-phosphate aminotransferase (isomerizing)|uniref:glutamine--fructose-6-phosphate transaminase (isomerizing) n=1 Tax=Parvibaculum sp. TaxID=2024848 RepID=UPI001B29A1DA|nr:glutamine--fructose-6-phosphate transaminase (isomerizing) [Parvibaculum sp.]MBO6634577.1 glutamine--fructose-6-phosphate transaminase (isomerizing) [Parvibaculum sp.]MBO6679113.1 glutamine--fructose-6-phosphate transaminase (isomerizing) [Parvibaculum sp.]MBO6683974.1 glutamine--fructose-6-phosphate transaminase (isomerizing) [Parvibaculum sp.]
MCGIVGIIGTEPVAPTILEALKRLEYRGYDSAGIATLSGGEIERRRAEGKLSNLERLLGEKPLEGTIGIGHTRWATHGAPTERNAHPHATDRVAIVHNGIIENFRELRERLTAGGATFATETDSEVIAHLVTHYLDEGMPAREAAAATIGELEGAFALGIIFRGDEDLMIGARQGSPLAVGYGDNAMYLGSDAFALAPMTNRVTFLEEGDRVEITRTSAVIHDAKGRIAKRPVKITDVSAALVDKGNHRHFMAKEIFEQPEVIGHTLTEYLDPLGDKLRASELPFDLAAVPRITIVACGTAYYAGLVAKYWFEKYARISVEVDIASEFRYREAALLEGGLAIFVSQSGETADTLAALHYCRSHGQKILSVVNVTESSIARASDAIMPTFAGPEIGVASTKAFTCQLATLAVLAVRVGLARGTISPDDERRIVRTLMEVPRHVAEALTSDQEIQALSAEIAKARDVLYLGRGHNYPIALEGALKLKEISYIHAEGYAAGELKHGPIALIDEEVPVVVIAPVDALFEKTISNMQEVIARGGHVVLIADREGIARAGEGLWAYIEVPAVDPLIAPIVNAIPVQLLAYHTAVSKGTDVDQPRNLAKSVTVE